LHGLGLECIQVFVVEWGKCCSFSKRKGEGCEKYEDGKDTHRSFEYAAYTKGSSRPKVRE
jgi:hypothetical protein